MKSKYDKYSFISAMTTVFIFTVLMVFAISMPYEKVVEEKKDNVVTIDLSRFEKKIIKPVPQKVKKRKVVKKKKKKVVKKKVKPVEPEVVEEEIIESEEQLTDTVPEIVEEVEEVIKTPVVVPAVDYGARKERLLANLIKLIETNKYYPRIAVKKNIEGVVTVKITVSKEGVISNYEIVESGHRYLSKGVKKTFNKIGDRSLLGEALDKELIVSLPVRFGLN